MFNPHDTMSASRSGKKSRLIIGSVYNTARARVHTAGSLYSIRSALSDTCLIIVHPVPIKTHTAVSQTLFIVSSVHIFFRMVLVFSAKECR